MFTFIPKICSVQFTFIEKKRCVQFTFAFWLIMISLSSVHVHFGGKVCERERFSFSSKVNDPSLVEKYQWPLIDTEVEEKVFKGFVSSAESDSFSAPSGALESGRQKIAYN